MDREQVKANAEVLCAGLPGWCSTEKRAALVDSVFALRDALDRPLVIVEIGVFYGNSFGALALAAEATDSTAFGVDPWKREASVEGMISKENIDWWASQDYDAIHRAVVNAFSGKERVHILRMTSSEASAGIPQVDLIHIDGNHSEEKSVLDVRTWLPKVPIGGYVWMDDIDWHEHGIFTTIAACKLIEVKCELLQTIKLEGRNGCSLYRKVR